MDSINSDEDVQSPEDGESTESVRIADKNIADQDGAEDVKVARALAQMKGMGFSDKGGWLSNLPDAIQPNRQQ